MERPKHNSNPAGFKSGGEGKNKSNGCLINLFMFILGLSVMTFGFGVSLLWIYTGGHLDQRSIERALPVIQNDFETTFQSAAKGANIYLESAR